MSAQHTPGLIEALEALLQYVDRLAGFARVDARVMRAAAKRESGTPYAVECLRKAERSDAEEARHAAQVASARAAIAKAKGGVS